MIELGIDAGDLLTDVRGKGRYLRTVLAALAGESSIKATLLAPDRIVEELQLRFAHTRLPIASMRDAKRDRFDIVWYPWNTLRFPTQSYKVTTIHDTFSVTDPSGNLFEKRRARRDLLTAARDSEHLIALSAWSREQISRTLDVNEAAVSVVMPAPDASWYPALEDLAYPELGDMPYVLCVASEQPGHNTDLLIDAFRHAFRRRDVRLVVCGSLGKKSARRLGRLKHTKTLEPNDAQLRSLYRNAHAVAVPSTREAYSFTAAEASACGAAVVAADSAALPETVGRTGLLVTPDDRKAWTEALRSVIEDTALNSRLRASAVNHWNAVSRSVFVDQLVDVFRDVIGR